MLSLFVLFCKNVVNYINNFYFIMKKLNQEWPGFKEALLLKIPVKTAVLLIKRVEPRRVFDLSMHDAISLHHPPPYQFTTFLLIYNTCKKKKKCVHKMKNSIIWVIFLIIIVITCRQMNCRLNEMNANKTNK